MPQILSSLSLSEISLVDKPANAETDPVTGLKIPRATVALWKRDADVAKGVKYLVSGADGDHLPYTGPDGKPDHNLMGAAYAALHSNHRGQPYGGPGKAGAISRLNRIYEQENMPTPANKGDSMTLEQIEKKVTEQDAAIAKLTTDNATLKTDNEVLTKMTGMTAKQKKAFGAMSKEKKGEFMAGDAAKQKAMMKEACPPDDDDDAAGDGASDDSAKKIAKVQKAADERIAAADERIKAQDARIVKTEVELADVRKRARLEHFTKRAEDELPHTAGKPVEKGETLMQLADSLGGEESDKFKGIMATMKAAESFPPAGSSKRRRKRSPSATRSTWVTPCRRRWTKIPSCTWSTPRSTPPPARNPA